MPPVSQAQRGWAYANAGKNTAEGRAAAEFVATDKPGKLPIRKRKSSGRKKAVGLINRINA